MFETFSFLPPLTSEQIGKQIDYITRNGWTPCLEFAEANKAYVSDDFCVRFGNVASVSPLFFALRFTVIVSHLLVPILDLYHPLPFVSLVNVSVSSIGSSPSVCWF
jgi:hypothetical protein